MSLIHRVVRSQSRPMAYNTVTHGPEKSDSKETSVTVSPRVSQSS